MNKPNRCQNGNCQQRAKYFSGSLKREMEGKEKFQWLCDSCEKAEAAENATVRREAEDEDMSVIEYVEVHRKGGRR